MASQCGSIQRYGSVWPCSYSFSTRHAHTLSLLSGLILRLLCSIAAITITGLVSKPLPLFCSGVGAGDIGCA